MSERDEIPPDDPGTGASGGGDLQYTDPALRVPRRIYARLAVLAAVLLTLITAGTLAWRWYQDRFPNAVLVAIGDKTANGVEVVVRTEEGREVARGTLSAQNDYQFAVLVEQGYHMVRATVQDQTFLEQRVYVPNSRQVELRISVPPKLQLITPATAPSPRSAAPALSAQGQLPRPPF